VELPEPVRRLWSWAWSHPVTFSAVATATLFLGLAGYFAATGAVRAAEVVASCVALVLLGYGVAELPFISSPGGGEKVSIKGCFVLRCPRCGRVYGVFIDSVFEGLLPEIRCSCGYVGKPEVVRVPCSEAERLYEEG